MRRGADRGGRALFREAPTTKRQAGARGPLLTGVGNVGSAHLPVYAPSKMETAMAQPTPPPYDLEALVILAFRTARDRGRPNWVRMNLAVLKNRLLQLSHLAFKESFHGAPKL